VIRPYGHLLIASLPAAVIGIGNLGAQIRAIPHDPAGIWQLGVLDALGVTSDVGGVFASLATGAVFWLPLLIVALVVSFGWGTLFARSTGRPLDPVWLPAAWLFALMLPASVPLGMAAVSLSFGLVFGCHVFGGTDRYLVNPALLAVVFVGFGYPALMAPDAILPGGGAMSTWSLVAATGIDVARIQGIELPGAMTGHEIGVIGATSALACLIGAAYLIVARVASLAIVASALIGSIAAAIVGSNLPWTWHLALGNFAFAVAFIATDTTTCPATRAGRWIYGALFGVLTIVLRTANPSHPEGTWAALLLASLCIPLVDRIAQTVGQTLRVEHNA
jgi:Na+-transporting NADH:ubiquinone oxidoreductase subunit B